MIDTLLTPLYYAVTAILLGWRHLLSPVFGVNSGATWTLSIVGLVVVIRIILIPLFVKQINASRKMVALQPKMKALQERHKGDRERLSQETMKLYKEEKANPFASCLPLLLQSPVFFALFRTLDGAAKAKNGRPVAHHGLMTLADANSLNQAHLFGAGLSDTFTHAPTATVKVITIILIVAMSLTTFTTQRQLTRKNMPPTAMTGPMAQQQKLLLYGYPVFFAITGINFPIGVLLYWLTTNLWTTGQQFYVIRRNPTPGSPAWDELQARRRDAGTLDRAAVAVPAEAPPAATAVTSRQQPRRTTRSERGGVQTPVTVQGAAAAATVAPSVPVRPSSAPARRSGGARPAVKTATAAAAPAKPSGSSAVAGAKAVRRRVDGAAPGDTRAPRPPR